VSEEQLLRAVIGMAELLGWRCAHFRPAKTEKGWRTAMSGARAKGFPDLVMVRERVLFRELKVGRNKPSPEQSEWIEDLTAAGADAKVWTDKDWLGGVIDSELARPDWLP
jgi:hypothetical protein